MGGARRENSGVGWGTAERECRSDKSKRLNILEEEVGYSAECGAERKESTSVTEVKDSKFWMRGFGCGAERKESTAVIKVKDSKFQTGGI